MKNGSFFRAKPLRMLVEAGVMIALAMLLSLIKLYQLPQSGSITPASMLPILFFAVRWGVRPGLSAGFAYGLLQFLVSSMYPSPLFEDPFLALGSVIVLDYLLAFGVLGLAGLFKGRRFSLPLGVLTGGFLRFIVHYISGVILWSSFAGDVPAWLYSLIYNGSFMGVEIAICMVAALALMKPLDRFVEGRDIQARAA